MNSDDFIKDQFVELEKNRNELVKKVHDLAEKTGAQLAISNDRIKKLETAIGKIKGKTWYDWVLLGLQIIIVITAFFAVIKDRPVSFSPDGKILIDSKISKPE